MIPLAQFLSEFDEGGDVFIPLPSAGRKPATPASEAQFERLEIVPGEAAAKPQASAAQHAIVPAIEDMSDEPAQMSPSHFGATHNDRFDAEEAGELHAAGTQEPIVPLNIDAMLEEAAETARQEATAKALETMQAEIDSAVEAAREEERSRAETERAEAMIAARAEWAQSEGEQFGNSVRDRLDRIEMIVKASFASILRPLATKARDRQSVLELVDTVDLLLGDGQALSLNATGPADLLEALGEALGHRRSMLSMTPDEKAPEVRLVCNHTVVETRLMGWRTALEEALS